MVADKLGGPIFVRYLDVEGDGTGLVKNHNLDYSAAPVNIRIQPPPGQIFVVTIMTIIIKDEGGMRPDLYGSHAALTNGITIVAKRYGEVVQDVTQGIPIKTNGGWSKLAHESEHFKDDRVAATFSEHWVSRWFHYKAGDPFFLDGTYEDELVFILSDDFSGLEEHFLRFSGYIHFK